MLMASGDAHWADRIEQMTFNALPGVVTKDFKQLQYFSSPNQILCSSTACGHIAMTRMSYRAAHETPCCSGNVNRAMPNYVSRMWMRMNGGLAATLFGPSEIKTEINGQKLSIVQETDYPFRDTISFEVKTEKPVELSACPADSRMVRRRGHLGEWKRCQAGMQGGDVSQSLTANFATATKLFCACRWACN